MDPIAWLSADRATSQVGFLERTAYSPAGGGYVTTASEAVYRFPLAMSALETGMAQELTLEVPYRGKLPTPRTNYREQTEPDGRKSLHTWGPYVLGLTGVRVQSRTLELTVGMERWAARLEFDLDQVEDAR